MEPNEIKRLREKLNKSQEEFAQLVGVSLQTIYRWETGKTKPSRLALKALQELEDRLKIKGK